MKVAVYHDPRYGPSVVFTLPGKAEVPESASIPQGPFPRATAQFAAKGPGLSWLQWAGVLAKQLPYFESWTVEDVPAGMSAHNALSVVRHQEADRFLGVGSGEQQPNGV